jgi:hypothetical protein
VSGRQVDTDEQPPKARPDKIPGLKPAFREGGTVTAANASSISDGAAALLLMRLSEAQERGLTPLARILGHAGHAQAPNLFTHGPGGRRSGVCWRVSSGSRKSVDLFEINEAFAVVPMVAMRELGIDHGKLNVNGGACAWAIHRRVRCAHPGDSAGGTAAARPQAWCGLRVYWRRRGHGRGHRVVLSTAQMTCGRGLSRDSRRSGASYELIEPHHRSQPCCPQKKTP